MKKINDVNFIYKYLCASTNLRGYFSRNLEIRNETRDQSKGIYEEIVNPEISKKGLLKRRENLHTFILSIFYLSLYLTVILILITGLSGLIRNNLELSTIIISIPFYFIGYSLVLSVRCHIADLDYLRYKRLKRKRKLENFKISKTAEPKIYDFFPALLFPILYYNIAVLVAVS